VTAGDYFSKYAISACSRRTSRSDEEKETVLAVTNQRYRSESARCVEDPLLGRRLVAVEFAAAAAAKAAVY